jgi:hypothetical protein
MKLVWVDITGEKVMVDNVDGKALYRDSDPSGLQSVLPYDPPILQITDDPWATVDNIAHVNYTIAELNDRKQVFSFFGQRPGNPEETVDIKRLSSAETGYSAGDWQLWRSGSFGEVFYRKDGIGVGPEGTYDYVKDFDGVGTIPETLTVARTA